MELEELRAPRRALRRRARQVGEGSEHVWVAVMMAEEHQLTPVDRKSALRSATHFRPKFRTLVTLRHPASLGFAIIDCACCNRSSRAARPCPSRPPYFDGHFATSRALRRRKLLKVARAHRVRRACSRPSATGFASLSRQDCRLARMSRPGDRAVVDILRRQEVRDALSQHDDRAEFRRRRTRRISAAILSQRRHRP
jgi:hypothetical protein